MSCSSETSFSSASPRLARVFAALAMVLLVGTGEVALASPKRVLLLPSFGRNIAPYSVFAEVFRTELAQRSTDPIDFYDVALDSAKFSDAELDGPLVDYLTALFADRAVDLVVPLGGPAARFVQRNRTRLFPHTAVLLAAVDQRLVNDLTLTDRDAVVAVEFEPAQAIESILGVLPQTRQIEVILGNSPLEKFWMTEFQREFAPLQNRVRFNYLTPLSLEQLRKHVAMLPQGSAIFYGMMAMDADGVPHEEEQALAALHAVANAPIFGLQDYQLGRGIVGGPLMGVREVGRDSASVAVRMLQGERPSSIKTPARHYAAPAYDFRELRRWQISERMLPAGSSVHFREPTIWTQYGGRIASLVGLCVGQAVLIGVLFASRARRRRAEEFLRQSEARSHELSGRLINSQENERARLARELHDDVTQRLARLAIDIGRIERGVDLATPQALGEVQRGLVSISEDVHDLAYRLHPSVLEDLGLADAIRTECDHVTRHEAVLTEVRVRPLPDQLPREASVCLFRITQEALRNVVRHSRARAVQISLGQMDGGLQLAVRDDGIGFDPSVLRARPSLGHSSMRERARLLGGELDIESAPGQGTTVLAWVPLNGGNHEQATSTARG